MMKKDQLHTRLNELWASTIESLSVDLCSQTIGLELSALDGGTTTEWKVVFEGVSSFLYVTGEGEHRIVLDAEPWDYLELSEIYFDVSPVDEVVYRALLGDEEITTRTQPNFRLEIWSTILLIEAAVVVINGERYDVSTPSEDH